MAMNRQAYSECHRVSDADNAWLVYYDEAFCSNNNTKAEDDKQCYLGSNYSMSRDWYYQWDRDEKHYYVVVDAPATATTDLMSELDKWLEEV